MSPQSQSAPEPGPSIADLEARLAAEQKRYQEEFRQFAYAVSHDLREPIRMIVSYTQLLERRYKGELDSEGQEFMRYIMDATQRMDRLLGDLLLYSQQFRTVDQPLAEIDPEGALQGAILTIEPLVRESAAKITSEPLLTVSFDFGQMTLLFKQLLTNAITFRGTEPPKIQISAVDAGDAVQFSVQDNGIGIEPKYQEQIFGVFKRLHGRELPGTGIGLAVCKRIVEQRGGRIWVESEPGKGSTFHFTVPK